MELKIIGKKGTFYDRRNRTKTLKMLEERKFD